MRKLFVVVFITGVTGATARAAPSSVAPLHYTLRLSPHFDTRSLDGDETIRLQINAPVSRITLNAAEITVLEAAIEGPPSSTASIGYDAGTQTVSLTFPNALPRRGVSII